MPTRPAPLRILVLAAAVLAATAAGCGPSPRPPAPTPAGSPEALPTPSSDSSGPTAIPASAMASASGTTGGGQPPAPPANGTGPTPGPPHAPSQNDVQAALLTVAEMPGFAIDSTTDSSGANSLSGCPPLDTDFTAGATASAEVLFRKDGSSPFIRERLRQFPVPGAQAAMSRIRSASSSCHSFSGTDPTLGKVDFTVTTMATPSYGDETAALRVTMKPERYPATILENLVAIRRGGTLLMISDTDVNSIDNALTSSVVSKAYDKVTRHW